MRSLSRRYASERQKPWRRREALPSTLFRDELRQSHQIVGGGSEGEGPPDAAATAELRLLLPGHRLISAERLFDALADALTDGIAAVPRRACVDRRTSAAGVLRHMRRHCHRAQLIDEVFRVVGLVGTERDRARSVGARFDHGERRYPLAWPSAGVRQASTRRPWRFSIKPWPMKQSLASLPGPLR